MIARFPTAEAPLDTLAQRRAQAGSTLIAPIALYSTAMNLPEAKLTDLRGPGTTVQAALGTERRRSRTSTRRALVAGTRLKSHSQRCRWRRGFVQPGLSAIRNRPAADNA